LAGGAPALIVLVAVEEVHRADLVVDEVAHRLAELDAPAILGDATLLLGELAEGEAQRAKPAIRGVELGAGARHRHPHRRVRLLVYALDYGPLGHGPELPLVGVSLLGPHLRKAPHELVPGLLGDVGIGAEAAKLGPGGGATRAHLQA